MKVTVQIIGWHPRWRKIDSITEIKRVAGCGLAEAKTIVDNALNDLHPRFDVEGLVQAKELSQKLADLGAIVSCVGDTYDSFKGDTGGIPYRKEAVGRMVVDVADSPTFSGTLIDGEVPDEFSLSLPINGSLDFRTDSSVVSRSNGNITFKIHCEDSEEIQLWKQLIEGCEVDIHRLAPREH